MSAYIEGNTGVSGNYFKCQVFIHDYDTGKLITSLISNDQGFYRYEGLKEHHKYIITVIDIDNVLTGVNPVSHVITPYV